MIPLRQYQLAAIERVRAALRAGRRRPLIVAPTGSGKTVLAAHLLRSVLEHGKRGLVLAHRRELIKQPFCKLLRNGIAPSDVGVIMAGTPGRLVDAIAPAPADLSDAEVWHFYGRRRPDARVQIASIDTARGRSLPPADIVVIDEAHRSLARSYVDIAERYPRAVIVGLTATPMRADGRGLDEFYDEMVVVAQYGELVAEGFLCEPSVWTQPVTSLPDVSGVRVKGGDYDVAELATVVDKRELVGDLVAHYQRHGNGAPALAFGVNVVHSRHIAERFVEAGIPAAHVDANTPKHERDAAVAGLLDGSIRVVSNVDVFTEGTDIPCIKTILLARPTMSLRVFLQQVGRGSRPAGNMPFVILDHAGCAVQHGLPQIDREWSLSPPKRRRRKDDAVPPTRTCPVCFAVLAVQARVCPPPCGFEFPAPEAKELEEKAGNLVEVNRKQLAAELAQWTAVVKLWRDINARRAAPLARRWCLRTYTSKYGKPPPPGAKLPRAMPVDTTRPNRWEPSPALEALPEWAKTPPDAACGTRGLLTSSPADEAAEPGTTSADVVGHVPARGAEETGSLFARTG